MKVFVDTTFGTTFSCDIDPRNKVFDIKKSIENSQYIPVSMQTLYFNSMEPIVDHYQLGVYPIVNNSRLLLLLRAPHVINQMLHQSPYAIQGFVPSMPRSNYNQVPPSHASASFYNQDPRTMARSNQVLPPSHASESCFNQYRRVSNDGLFPEMPPQDISLKQGFWPGTTFGDNVKIQESLRRNKMNQDLLQREPSLASNTFGDLSLCGDFTNIRSHWPAITTKSIANQNHMFQTDRSITLGDFSFGEYRHILTGSNWPASTFDEIISKNQVESNSTEESSNRVFQTKKSPPPQKLTVIMTQYDKPRRKFLLEVNASDNVEELKKYLEYLFELPAEGYFLLHKVRVLDDDKSFSINRVADGDTIEIFPGPDIKDYRR